jgi:CHAT domain-containing protein
MQRMLNPNQKALPVDPLSRCGLLLAGANIALSGQQKDLPEGVQDGILTAKEISLLDLTHTQIAVLSACETGRGEITAEGVFGLQRALKQAGVATIIMSLWPVDDAATQLLMQEFYQNWIKANLNKNQAFAQAQKTVQAKYPSPEYWAGFILLD